jgi:hypothetical protein
LGILFPGLWLQAILQQPHERRWVYLSWGWGVDILRPTIHDLTSINPANSFNNNKKKNGKWLQIRGWVWGSFIGLGKEVSRRGSCGRRAANKIESYELMSGG